MAWLTLSGTLEMGLEAELLHWKLPGAVVKHRPLEVELDFPLLPVLRLHGGGSLPTPGAEQPHKSAAQS